jgi:hypothetical protein
MRHHLLVAAVWVVTTGGVHAGAATLAIQGRANATPSVAAANQFVVVAWGATDETKAGTTDVYLAISRDGGRTVGAAVRVSDERHASLGAEQPPRVALVPQAGRDPEVVVVWTAKSKDGSRLLISRSQNGGASFTRAAPIPGSEATGNRGWESIAVDRDGHVMAVWLDHREILSPPGNSAMHHDGHDHRSAGAPKADAAGRAQSSKLYFVTLDGEASSHAVTGGVCYCCKTAFATGPDGAIYVAWRHVYPGNRRDIAFTMSRDRGRTFAIPVRVSSDGWILDGCPENGPALAVGADDVVHALWPTLVAAATPDAEPTLALFHASVRDGGTFSPRERIATEGTPRHPQLTATPAGLVAAWDEQEGGSRRVVLARLARRGSAPTHVSREIVSDNVRAQTPAIAATSNALVIAWAEGTEQSVIRVERR